MTRLFGGSWVCCLLLSLTAFGLHAAEYDVKQDGTGDFIAIQEAIDAAVDGDKIVVHPGTYYENIHFDGRNITLRSLDPEDQETVASTVIDGGQNGSVVTFDGTESEACLLSGFTITNGKSEYGGGILGGDPSSDPPVLTLAAISYCTITGNTGRYGGGLYYCSGAISRCTIAGNASQSTYGGGLFSCAGAITHCTISGNTGGGGLFSCGGAITKCTISGNSAAWTGGGLNGCRGTITDCTITGNSAGWSGGGFIYCSGAITNCVVSNNSGSNTGGGFCSCNGTIRNCTISGNSAMQGGGLYSCNGTIANCILWGDDALNGPELFQCDSAAITHCCIQGWTGGGDGNTSEDPLFVTGPQGDYYLSHAGVNAEKEERGK